MLPILSLCLCAVAAPVPAPKEPIGPPPRVEVVQVGKTGELFLEFTSVEFAPLERKVAAMIGGKQVIYRVIEQVEVTKTCRIRLGDEDVEVFDREGRRVKPEDVRNRLTPSMKVLLSTDGKAIHPSHLERHRELNFSVVSRPPPPAPAFPPQPAPAPLPPG